MAPGPSAGRSVTLSSMAYRYCSTRTSGRSPDSPSTVSKRNSRRCKFLGVEPLAKERVSSEAEVSFALALAVMIGTGYSLERGAGVLGLLPLLLLLAISGVVHITQLIARTRPQ